VNDWNTAPTLSGEHVRLEPLTPEHAKGLFEAGTDPGIWAWLSVRQPGDLLAAERMVEQALTEPGRQPFAQIDVASGRVAGTTSYYQVVEKHRILSIGHTWLGAEWQHTALNTDAKLLLLTHAFETLAPNGSRGRPTSATCARNAPSNGSAHCAKACCARTGSGRTARRATPSRTRCSRRSGPRRRPG
jgi:hypothetical protein